MQRKNRIENELAARWPSLVEGYRAVSGVEYLSLGASPEHVTT
jgi:hypothetical protein